MVYTNKPKKSVTKKAKARWRSDTELKVSKHNIDRVATGKIPINRKADGRTSFVRAIKTYYTAIMLDLGATVDANDMIDKQDLSTLEAGMAKQCAALMALMDEMLLNKANGEYVEGEAWDMKNFTDVQKAYAHLARQIGLEKRPRIIEEQKDLSTVISNIKKTD